MKRVKKMKNDKKKQAVSPFAGGCWFCEKKTTNMQFSCEFDTMVHKNCIKKALIANSKHPEAKIMAREFDITIK